MRRLTLLAFLTMFCVAGCAQHKQTPAPETPMETYYKNVPNPAAYGMARIYLLPPVEDGQDVTGDLYLGTGEDQKNLAFKIKKNEMAVFDVMAGQVYVDFESYDAAYFDEAKSFTLSSGQTLVLRPIMHFSGNVLVPASGSGDGALAALALDVVLLPVSGVLRMTMTHEPSYEILDYNSALTEIRSRRLSLLAPTAPPFVKQTIAF